uniref:Endoribonuclease YbeY n=1 Tax=Eubacterium cellulosolvens (strain ATCC 43171 / JCM 9499 / 6) TaxID=633697 RepID=I5AQS4_EUBC6
MTINLENEQELEIPFDYEETAGQIVTKILDEEKCPYEAEVSITFVDDEEIRRVNREFRGIDKVTDVLSFPVTQFTPPADFSILEDDEAAADSFDPESGELQLGDILISVSRAMKQAEEYGHSLKREIGFLIAHSVLHLMGYDHMTEEEATVMEKKQARYLEDLGITRDAQIPDGGVRSDKH